MLMLHPGFVAYTGSIYSQSICGVPAAWDRPFEEYLSPDPSVERIHSRAGCRANLAANSGVVFPDPNGSLVCQPRWDLSNPTRRWCLRYC